MPSKSPIPSELSVTLAPLGSDIRATLERLASLGFRHVQLSAAQPGLRPRELDRSARRDLLAVLRRFELSLNGIDFFLPESHWNDPANADRAVTAANAAVELAADLGRVPLSIILPAPPPSSDTADTAQADLARQSLSAFINHAQHHGVDIADHALTPAPRTAVTIGIDPAICIAAKKDPAVRVLEAGSQLRAARLVDLLPTGMRGPVLLNTSAQLDALAYRVALDVAGYRSPITIDARQWETPWEGIIQTAETWSRLPAMR